MDAEIVAGIQKQIQDNKPRIYKYFEYRKWTELDFENYEYFEHTILKRFYIGENKNE